MLLQRDFNSNEINDNIILELKQQKFFETYCNEAKKKFRKNKK